MYTCKYLHMAAVPSNRKKQKKLIHPCQGCSHWSKTKNIAMYIFDQINLPKQHNILYHAVAM